MHNPCHDNMTRLVKARAVFETTRHELTTHVNKFAVQLFFAVHVKTDPNDDTIGLTPYSISAPNASTYVVGPYIRKDVCEFP